MSSPLPTSAPTQPGSPPSRPSSSRNRSSNWSPRHGRPSPLLERSFSGGALAEAERAGRKGSLGDLHQSLESEQEGQVNRLLGMIRETQATIASQVQRQPTPGPDPEASQTSSTSLANAMSLSRTSSQHSTTSSQYNTSSPRHSCSHTHSSSQDPYPRPSSSNASANTSPFIRATHSQTMYSHPSPLLPSASQATGNEGDWLPSVSVRERDEVDFLRKETESITRENRMLQARVKELERLVRE